MKIQKLPFITRTEPAQAHEPTPQPAVPDTAERTQVSASKIATGLDAGAASLRLSVAVKDAQALTLNASTESAFADLVRVAALASDAEFQNALSAFPTPLDAADLLSMLDLRASAIAPELADPTHFNERVRLIKTKLEG